MDAYLVTGNEGKLAELQEFLDGTRLRLKQLEIDGAEPSYNSVEQVARWKIEQAIETIGTDAFLIADDTGLFVDSLGGFPGPQTAFFDRTAGKERLLSMIMEDESRSATFRTAIAVFEPGAKKVYTFLGECRGELVAPRGDGGFGYDPMFVPDGRDTTFAEDVAYKKEVSHRTRALSQFKDWLE